ncbi:MAG: hypothetical protein ACQEQS_06960 [Thermodesulfobacteriota bacterium]
MYKLKIFKLTVSVAIFSLLIFSSVSAQNIDKDSNQNYLKSLNKVYSLYAKSDIKKEEIGYIFSTIENIAGIDDSGKILSEQALKTEIFFKKNSDKLNSDYVSDQLFNLLGLYYIYLETATFYKQKEKFINFFENGFFENRDFYSKGKYYYRILYFYLVNTQDEIISKINKAVEVLNKNRESEPDFSEKDINRLEKQIIVSNELIRFIRISEYDQELSGINFNKIFDSDERQWIKTTAGWFTDTDNFLALYSYEWFSKNIPVSVPTALISDKTALNWEQQSVLQRKKLPLVFYNDGKNEYKTNIDELFNETVKYLKFNNRQIDIIVVSALKSWITKQIKQGVNVEDRLKYKNILEELNVCPSGWIFYNLYELRQHLARLKEISVNWETESEENKGKLFENEVRRHFYSGRDNIDNIFKELKVIFGSSGEYSHLTKENDINYIFHKYQGELYYYYENIFFSWVKEFSQENVRVPSSDIEKDCVEEFSRAFIKAPEVKANHENLLKAYNLYLNELLYNGSIVKITELNEEFMHLVNDKKLGSILPNSKNNTYDILHIFANTFIRSPSREDKALDIAIKSFDIAFDYYKKAAEDYGFIVDNQAGALNNKCTEIDDYQREFEFLKKIAEKSGKNIQLIISEEKIKLYNKLRSQV